MITPNSLRKKLQRTYQLFLESWLTGSDTIFPYPVPVGRIPSTDYHALREGTLALQADSKKWGYELEMKMTKFASLGEKTYPTQIIIPNKDVMLSMLSKKKEYSAFQKDVALIQYHLPQLEDWLSENIKSIIKYHGIWDDLIKVCEYFISNPSPNCYIRELPVEVHTKFVESYKPILTSLLDTLLPSHKIHSHEKKFEKRYSLRYNEALVRIRILDERLCREHSFPFADMSIRVSDSASTPIHAKNCLIIENKMTFLTLPQLPNTIAIWGQGKRVSTLRDLVWLNTTGIFYWGDLDVDGFGILSNLRDKFAHVRSIMMDEQTFLTFEQYSVSNKPSATPKLNNLTPDETQMYYWLMTNQRRLEQEHISHPYLLQTLNEVIF